MDCELSELNILDLIWLVITLQCRDTAQAYWLTNIVTAKTPMNSRHMSHVCRMWARGLCIEPRISSQNVKCSSSLNRRQNFGGWMRCWKHRDWDVDKAGNGREIFPHQPTRFWRGLWASRVGSGVEPQPKWNLTHFKHQRMHLVGGYSGVFMQHC